MQADFPAQRHAESRNCTSGIVFAAVEAAVDGVLNTSPKGMEQSCYRQCGADESHGVPTGEAAQERLQDEDVDIPQAGTQNSDPEGKWNEDWREVPSKDRDSLMERVGWG